MGDNNVQSIQFKVENLEDVERLIRTHYPKGLESARKLDGGFEDGAYHGFNLSRFLYTEQLAAELHAARDAYLGKVGHSYGFPFEPHVKKRIPVDGGEEYFEVYTA